VFYLSPCRAPGEMLLPTFLDKHVNHSLASLHQSEPELRGKYKDAKGRTKTTILSEVGDLFR